MKPSTFNYVVRLDDGRTVLLNTLSGAIDLVPDEALACLADTSVAPADDVRTYLSDRRYLLEDSIDESNIVADIYRELLLKTRQQKTVHCILILSFGCNLRCTYCWQQQDAVLDTRAQKAAMTTTQVDRLTEAVGRLSETAVAHPDTPPEIQLFGGEPLLPRNRKVIEYILAQCRDRCWPVQITTNGVFLDRYADLITEYDVREVQVTIDGPRGIHNSRRLGSDYDKLMRALDRLIQPGTLTVKVRTNVDFTNLDGLPALADEIYGRHWYASGRFYAYLAPLRDAGPHCYSLIERRGDLLNAVLDLVEREPKLEVFDMLGWDGYQPVRRLAATGRFPYPRAHICDTNLNQFVFTPGGDIYLCAEQATDRGAIVGTYSPEFHIDPVAFRRVYDHRPLDLARCAGCALLPVCGGGCQLWEEHSEMARLYCRAVDQSFSSSIARAFRNGDLP